MPLVMAIIKGPEWFEPLELSPAAPFVFGRGEDAGWSIPRDHFLSTHHFRVECHLEEGEEGRKVDRWKIRDVGSRNGTFVNGSRVRETMLHDGDTISAGETTFRAIVTQENVARTLTPQERLIYLLGAQPEPLYAIIDCARAPEVAQLIQGTSEKKQCLFTGEQSERLAEFAPYLVQLTLKDTLLISLIYGGWGNGWGSYFTSKAPFEALHQHMRQYLLLVDGQGNNNYFRYFDPRVLRKFLPRCRPDFLKAFFGPVSAWLVEGDDAGVAIKYERRDDALSTKMIPVNTPAQPGQVPR